MHGPFPLCDERQHRYFSCVYLATKGMYAFCVESKSKEMLSISHYSFRSLEALEIIECHRSIMIRWSTHRLITWLHCTLNKIWYSLFSPPSLAEWIDDWLIELDDSSTDNYFPKNQATFRPPITVCLWLYDDWRSESSIRWRISIYFCFINHIPPFFYIRTLLKKELIWVAHLLWLAGELRIIPKKNNKINKKVLCIKMMIQISKEISKKNAYLLLIKTTKKA